LELPDVLEVVPHYLLKQLADEAPGRGSSTRQTVGAPHGNGDGQRQCRLNVPQWLNDRGVAFRVKSQKDGKGRTVYVLKECPFDPSHGDPDSCVMQGDDGKLSAQCFHNSCGGRGWQQFKAKIGAPEARHYQWSSQRECESISESGCRRAGDGDST